MLTFSFLVELVFYVVIIFISLYLYFTRNFNHWKNKNVPYFKPLPFVGNVYNAVLMRDSMGEIFSDLYNKTMKPFIGFFILDKPCLLLRDPQLIKKVLISDFQHFYDRNILNNKRDDPISTHMLFLLKNPEWKDIRGKITPVFSSSKIKIMSRLIEDVGQEMVDYLEKTAMIDSTVDMKDVSLRFTVDVISTAVFGVNAYSFQNANSKFNEIAQKLFNWDDTLTAFRIRCYFLTPMIAKLFRMKFINPHCASFLKKSFLEIMDSRIASKVSRNDLIDILLQLKSNDKQFMDGDKLVAQAVMFFAAGFETSSSTMAFALHELAQHPDIQNKLRHEIDLISGKHDGINYDSLKEMEYLDMCVKEVLRKYPVLPFLDRKTVTDYNIPGTDVIIEKDTPVFIPILALHNDPRYFANPEVFDPERFSKTNVNNIEHFVYMPFGEGPRNCIGSRFGKLTTKLGLAYILKSFVVEKTCFTEAKIRFNPKGVALSPLRGMKLKLRKV
jgi:cytochrome P450 family 6